MVGRSCMCSYLEQRVFDSQAEQRDGDSQLAGKLLGDLHGPMSRADERERARPTSGSSAPWRGTPRPSRTL